MKIKILVTVVFMLLMIIIVPLMGSLKNSVVASKSENIPFTLITVYGIERGFCNIIEGDMGNQLPSNQNYQQLSDNVPPDKPKTPTGTIQGKPGVSYNYTTSTIDPDGDAVYYRWSWGDGNTSAWLGPYASGATISTNHTWAVKGSFNITVKARDTHRAESWWSDPLPITMPYSYDIPLFTFWERLLQRFPCAFLFLRYLIGY